MLDGHRWLVANVLDSVGLDPSVFYRTALLWSCLLVWSMIPHQHHLGVLRNAGSWVPTQIC